MTKEQIEAKKQQFIKLTAEANQLKDELVKAGAMPLDEDELDGVAGGFTIPGHPEQGNPRAAIR